MPNGYDVTTGKTFTVEVKANDTAQKEVVIKTASASPSDKDDDGEESSNEDVKSDDSDNKTEDSDEDSETDESDDEDTDSESDDEDEDSISKDDEESQETSNAAKTGDNAPMIPCMVLFVMAVAGVVVLRQVRRKEM